MLPLVSISSLQAVAAAVDPALRDALRTVVVSMPFQDAWRPSLQLGLLKAIGCAAGFPVETLHANLDFTALVGAELYTTLSDHRGRLVGDWLFSPAAFGESAPDPKARLLADFASDLGYLSEIDLSRLREIRDSQVDPYLDGLVEDVDWHAVRVVGFSSTFQQTPASLALAFRLKQRFPHLVTVFGGSNFDGDMGLEFMRALDIIDFAVIGEADAAFPALLAALAAGRNPAGIPGVACRNGEAIDYTPSPVTIRLDDLPVPDYREYFERRHRLGLGNPHEEVVIPFESARGCWWGAKHHCTFCGLNGTSMKWRTKSPERVQSELAEQAVRYGTFSFEAVDNILDPRYLTSLLHQLVEDELDYDLFYEVKANLTRQQIRTLALSGVRHIQPGIESLSSRVLGLMNKGVSAGQNVNLLRWARYYGIEVSWNLLWGFPGETEADYTAQAAAMPHLVHLQPPESAGRVWLERFSPMFTDEARFPVRYRRPEASYEYVYPRNIRLDEIAYFFDYEFDDVPPDFTYESVRAAVRDWLKAWEAPTRPNLRYRSSPDLLQIYDSRWPGREGTYTYRRDLARIYRAISVRPKSAAAVCKALDLRCAPESVIDVFEEWEAVGLVFRDSDSAVALALPATRFR